ncbi:hypothetical protein JCM8097_003426 [Rhodosporidiobolus ruineniae]
MASLVTLPAPVLDRIVSVALQVDPTLPTALISSVHSQLHHSLVRVLVDAITLPDDDATLLQAEDDHQRTPPTRSSLVSLVSAHPPAANEVHKLTVTRPVYHSALAVNGATEDPPFQDDLASSSPPHSPTSPSDAVPIPPLDSAAFFLLLSKLNNLTSFTWRSYRPPPDQLCPALGAAAPSLKHFELELLPSPFEDVPANGAGAAGGDGVMSSPVLGSSPSAFTSSSSHGHHHHPVTQRWDAPGLASLPNHSLTSLLLASLSQAGCKSLGAALPLFLALEELEVAKTLFVDDALLGDVGQGAARTLRRFKVREMGGTKLSEVGLGEVSRGCEGLEVLELDGVEGRLSRTCWDKLSPLPPSLHTLKLTYSESSPHKSWVLDHLSSLPSLLSSSSLTTLHLTRRLPSPAALLPGSHQLARFPIDPVVQPQQAKLTLGKRELDALAERGDAWRSLELDLFRVDHDGVRRILETCTGLRRLKVLYDAPFRNLLTLTASFSSVPSLRHFLVSIPPEHVPETAALTPSVYAAALASASASSALPGGASAPNSPPTVSSSLPGGDDPSPPPVTKRKNSLASSVTSSGADKSASGLHLPTLDSLLPPTRDWRRFLKKAHALEAVTWTGRGGIGSWRFGKPEGSSLVRVEFEPTRPAPGSEAFGAGEGESPAQEKGGFAFGLGGLVTPPPSGFLPFGPPPPVAGYSYSSRPRRRSSVSLAGSCLSGLSGFEGLSLSPSSPPFSDLGGFSPLSHTAGAGLGLETSPALTSGTSLSSFSPPPPASGFSTKHDRRASAASAASVESNPFSGRRRSTTAGSASSQQGGFPHSGGALGFVVGGFNSAPPASFSALPPVGDEVGWASPTPTTAARGRRASGSPKQDKSAAAGGKLPPAVTVPIVGAAQPKKDEGPTSWSKVAATNVEGWASSPSPPPPPPPAAAAAQGSSPSPSGGAGGSPSRARSTRGGGKKEGEKEKGGGGNGGGGRKGSESPKRERERGTRGGGARSGGGGGRK